MRLFNRGRKSRASAKVLSVETTDRLDQLCRIEVRPDVAPPFESTLRTRGTIVEDAETYVLYDPKHPEECEIDEARLRASGVRDERVYVSKGWDDITAPRPADVPRGLVTLTDAKARLDELDRIDQLRDQGRLTEAAYLAERERVLNKPGVRS